MLLEDSGQGRRNRLLTALAPEDHFLLTPHLKELSLELGSLLQEAGEPVEFIYFRLWCKPSESMKRTLGMALSRQFGLAVPLAVR
jgi:hypothetical protein